MKKEQRRPPPREPDAYAEAIRRMGQSRRDKILARIIRGAEWAESASSKT